MKQIYRFLSFFFIFSSATVVKAAVPVITSSLDSQTYWVNESFNYTITATESPDEYFAAGLEALGGTVTYFSASGLFEGAPGNAGDFDLAIAAENAEGRSETAYVNVVVVPSAITSSSSVNGVVGEEFSYEITTSSSEALTYSDSGSLPPGLTRSNNIISGTLTQAGIFPVTLSASDINGSGDIDVTFTITDSVPVITSSLEEEILVNNDFNYTITATNSPNFYTGSSGSVSGLSAVNPVTGEISGTPDVAGSYSITLLARNAEGFSSPATLNLVVHPGLITSSNTASAVVDSPFVFEITTVNNEGLAYSNDDNLPPGLTRVDNIISGTPTQAGTYPVTVSAANLDNFSDQVLTITVTNPTPEITSSLVDQNILAGVPYAGYTITGTYSPTGFSATGLEAVGGLVLDTVTGVISGTPVNSGIFPITVAAENVPSGFGNPSSFNIIVSPTVITSPSSTSGVVGTPLTYEITTAGTAPLAYGVQGSLPSGLSRSGTTISGTPDQAGTYTVTLSASNLDGTGSLPVTFTITDPAPVIDSSLATQTILVNESFSYTITATNIPTGFSANGLDLIGGLVLDTGTGVISGTPLNEGDWVIQIGAENDAGTSPLEDLNLVVKAAQYFLEAEVGVPFSHTLTTSLPNASIGVSGLGQIPGISRDSGTDDISGTPEEFGVYVVTVIATNEEGATDTYDLTVTINKSGGAAPIPVITSSTSVLLYEGDNLDYQIQADGIPDNFEVFGLGLLGLVLDSSTGEITGTPTSTGDFLLPVRVTNVAGTGSDILELNILPDISPEVVITSPSGGNSFVAGDYIEVLINATDKDGFITAVSVSVDGVVLGDATPTGVVGQYRYILTTGSDGAGTRSLQVIATDDRGNSTNSNILNYDVTLGAVPQLNIITPAIGFNATVGVPYEVRVTAVDSDGVIAAVGLNDIRFAREPATETTNANTGAVTVTPGDIIDETKSFGGQQDENVLTIMQPSSTPGEYVLNVTATFTDIVELVATAIDDAGNVVSSVPVQYSVNLGTPPDVSISSPLGGQSFTLGDYVPVEVIANDMDGIISQVEIFNSSVSLGLADLYGLNTYRFDYLANAPGEVYLQARATDDMGNVSISNFEIINVVTGNVPVVAIDELNSVSDGDSRTAGDNVTILVNATDTDGFITQVQIFNNGVLLGQADPTGVAGQYRYNLLTDISNIGVLRLEARATDDRGDAGRSSVVNLNVSPGSVPTVSIDSPSDGFTAKLGIPFEIRVSASDTDGSIASVRLRDINFQREEGTTSNDGVFTPGAVIESTRSFNGILMQESSVAGEYVYTATLSNPDIVDLVAVALDNSGNQVTSVPVQLNATTGSAPIVTITNPTNGGNSPYTIGDVIPIEISASDTDGSISKVEIYNGSTFLTEAFRTGETTFAFNYELKFSGLIELQARATDNQNNESVSGVETISVVRGESPTVNIASPLNGSQVTSGDVIEILLNVADTDGIITSVSVFKGGSSSGQALPTEVAGQYRYDLSTDINDVGSLDIWALANDEMGNRGYSNIVSITVEKASPKVTAGDPLTNDATFVNEVYLKLFNKSPSVAQLQEGLSVLDGSISSKCNYVASILASSTAKNSELAMMVYRTMIGEWPNSQQLQDALQALLSGSSSSSESDLQTAELTDQEPQWRYSKSLNQGDAVTANVGPVPFSTSPILVDPILSVLGPDGTIVAFNDDFIGFYPQVDFTADSTGSYTFEVSSYFRGSTGNFELDIETVRNGELDPNALTQYLKPRYEERFAALDTDLGRLNQLFFNKHSQAPSTQAEVRLFETLTGGNSTLEDGTIIPGYTGNDTSFITQFALDNNPSFFVGSDGLQLSSLHYYEMPNDPTSDLKVALAIAAFLGVDPTDQTLAIFSGMSLEQALENILLNAYASTPNALAGATSLGSDWYESSWFGMFAYTADSSNWIYSWRLGWVYVAPSSTPSGAWFYSTELSAWLWSNSEMNGFYYHAGRNTWVYMLAEGADSPGAWLNYMDVNQWQFVTP